MLSTLASQTLPGTNLLGKNKQPGKNCCLTALVKITLSIRCVTHEGGRDSHGAPCQTKSRKGRILQQDIQLWAVIAGLWTRQHGCTLICACMHDVSYFEHDKLQKKHGNTLPSEPIHATSIFIHVDTQSLSLSLSLNMNIFMYYVIMYIYIYTYTVHTCHPNTSHHQRSLEALDAWGPSFWHPS